METVLEMILFIFRQRHRVNEVMKQDYRRNVRCCIHCRFATGESYDQS